MKSSGCSANFPKLVSSKVIVDTGIVHVCLRWCHSISFPRLRHRFLRRAKLEALEGFGGLFFLNFCLLTCVGSIPSGEVGTRHCCAHSADHSACVARVVFPKPQIDMGSLCGSVFPPNRNPFHKKKKLIITWPEPKTLPSPHHIFVLLLFALAAGGPHTLTANYPALFQSSATEDHRLSKVTPTASSDPDPEQAGRAAHGVFQGLQRPKGQIHPAI